MTFLSKRLGLFSIICGIILNIITFKFPTHADIKPIILFGIIGTILALVSGYLKYENKWIGILGLILNVFILAYITFLLLALG